MRSRQVLTALAAGAAGVALGVLPALAADTAVTAGGGGANTFSPATVSIAVGDSVTWTNAGGTHNVHFDDGFQQPAAPSSSWSTPVTRTFPTAGTFAYHCDQHGTAMSGTVVVGGPTTGTTATTTGPTTTATTTGTTTTTSSTPATMDTTPTTTTPMVTFTVRATRSAFCNHRSKRCRKPGVFLSITLTGDDFEELRGLLRRRPLTGNTPAKPVGAIRVVAKKGTHTYRFQEVTSGWRIAKGRYTLALRRTSGGLPAPTVSFRVTS